LTLGLWIKESDPFLMIALALIPLPINSTMKSPTLPVSYGNLNISINFLLGACLYSYDSSSLATRPSRLTLVLNG
jgi:hypothetical protein